jgi:RNA polymerase sigma factor for flagellar operon FliA
LLGVSRSRISQVHRKALIGLKHLLAQGPPCDIFL